MKASINHIATSHVGSLPRPDGLIAANRALEAGEAFDEQAFQQTLRNAVSEVVRRQHELGIDIPGDGEFGKPMGQSVNYGSWWRYSWQRLGGLKPGESNLYDMAPRRSRPGEVVLTSFGDRRDRSSVRHGLRRSRVRHHHWAAAAGAGLRCADHLYRP